MPISLVALLILTVIAMLPGSHPSDWDPWVLSTINAPLPELIDGDRLASLIAAAEDAVPSCILDSFFLEVPPEAALRFLAARGIAIEAAKAAFQAACAPFLPPGSMPWKPTSIAGIIDCGAGCEQIAHIVLAAFPSIGCSGGTDDRS